MTIAFPQIGQPYAHPVAALLPPLHCPPRGGAVCVDPPVLNRGDSTATEPTCPPLVGVESERSTRPAASAPRPLTAAPASHPRPALRGWLREQQRRGFTLLALVELLLLLGVGLLMSGRPALEGWSTALAFSLASWVALTAFGLYQRHQDPLQARGRALGRRLLLALLVGLAGQALISRLLGQPLPLGPVLLGCLLAPLGLLLSRGLFIRWQDSSELRRRVLLLGAGATAASALQRLEEVGALQRIHVIGCVALPGDRSPFAHLPRVALGPPWMAQITALQVDELVVAADDRRGALPMAELLRLRWSGLRVTTVERLLERESGRVALDAEAPAAWVFSERAQGGRQRLAVQRGFDLLVASLLLSLLWPLLLLTALLLGISGRARAPVLYRQQRVGLQGRPFSLLKFRSMQVDAERAGVAQWASAADPRVTRIGHWLRRLRIDELPQLWNVLRGEMSMVGPRPERPQFVDQFSERIAGYGLRHCIRPGLTGWAQLRYPYGASEADAVEKLRFDLFYVKNQSLAMDLRLLLETVEVVLFGRGVR